MDVNFELKWHDYRLSFPEKCITKENALDTFNLDHSVWSSIWTPPVNILEISSVEEVVQLKRSLSMTLGYVRKPEMKASVFKYIFFSSRTVVWRIRADICLFSSVNYNSKCFP